MTSFGERHHAYGERVRAKLKAFNGTFGKVDGGWLVPLHLTIVLDDNPISSRPICPICHDEYRRQEGPWPRIAGSNMMVCLDCARGLLRPSREWYAVLESIEQYQERE